jgi:GNAT superfamily N-acetyltransferase
LITHFLGSEEVAAYCRDFAERLHTLNHNFPKKWFLLGQSGEKIGSVIFDFLPTQLKGQVSATTVYVDRRSNEVIYQDTIDDEKFGTLPVLLLDSAVHSGHSMTKVVQSLWKAGAENILTYALMLKRSSTLIPTYFGILVEDKDRVYFQLDVMPNNRLCETPPFGVLKEVSENDLGKSLGQIGPPFEDTTIGDFLYDKRTKDYHPYIYEYNGQVAGFIVFGKKNDVVFIDAWATTQEFRGKGIGGALLRWAETWARSNKCDSIQLWAYEPAIETYAYLGYEFVGNECMLLSATQKYRLMAKKLLYNSKLSGYWP